MDRKIDRKKIDSYKYRWKERYMDRNIYVWIKKIY